MKVSLNWLNDYVSLDGSPDEIAKAITFLGFEVESVAATGTPELNNVFVGEVLSRAPHPNADKLSICQVDVGPAGGTKTIVCGAQNFQPGDRVPVALPGAVLPGNFAIKQAKIRGQSSDGMMCSARELGAGDDQAGLLILAGRPAVGAPINSVLPPGDTVFDLEITPNRPDCLSHLGLARELAAWFGRPLVFPTTKFGGEIAGREARPDLLAGVRVDSPEDCPLYAAHVVTGVRVGPSPPWLQQRLRSVGQRPINNVVDVGNYVMLEYGQPLHAFDAHKLAGREIIVRRAADGERIRTLDGKDRALNRRMLVIADSIRPVIIAGIMGGEDSGVSESTTDLVLECAIFKRQSVRGTSRQLGLGSDSSYRYERGVDPHTALEAAYRALDLIVETAGGQIVGPSFRIGGDVPWKREVAITTGYVRDRLGFEIPEPEMRADLESLGLGIERAEPAAGGGTYWTVSIPSWRDDLDRPIDLVEEILRLHGTERIPPATVTAPGLVVEDDPAVLFNRRAAAYLVGQAFHECVNTTLRAGRELTTWVSEAAAAELALANPLVEDQSHLRPSLILGLLDSLKLNQSRGVPASRFFETGRVFVEHNGHNFECAAAGFVIAEDPERRWKKREPADFYTAKHHAAALAAAAGVGFGDGDVEAISADQPGWEPGQSASAGAFAKGWTARFGLLGLSLCKSIGVEGRVYGGFFAILPENLPAGTTRRRYEDVSPFPPALRDIALIADRGIPTEQMRGSVERIGRAAVAGAFALERVAVFDLYEGAGLPEGKKSAAFSLVFRAADRTLTDEEVNAAFQRIQGEIARTTSYVIRR